MPGFHEILESSFRSVIISSGLQFITFQLVDMAVFREKKRWPAYLYMLTKTFVLSASMLIAESRPEYFLLNAIVQLVLSAGVYLAFIWTWSDDPLHVLLIMSISEVLVTFPALFVPILVNMLEGRTATDLSGTIHVMDFLIPVLLVGLFYCLRPVCKIIMQFLGKQYLPYRKLLWAALFLFYIYTASPSIIGKNTGLASAGGITVLLLVLLSAALVIMLLILLLRFIKREDEEKRLLGVQFRLIEKRAAITSRIRGEVEKNNRIITDQMEELQERAEQGIPIEQGLLKSFINSLEEVKTKDYRGVYCKDAMVDEVLCQIREEAMRQGFDVKISVADYHRGNIAEDDLVRLLFCLGFAVIQDNKGDKSGTKEREKLLFSMISGRQRLCIRVCAPTFKLSRVRAAYVRGLVRSYHGGITSSTSKVNCKGRASGKGIEGKEILVYLRCAG